ncbi:hypothetical protein BDF22DRAFT_331726 [Syncephalis plumigaleata]|nr:hypothetical protein BDF22DRAFT_331726 [Syncephalis plumigaleata]
MTVGSRVRRCRPLPPLPPLLPIAEQLATHSPHDDTVYSRQPYSAGVVPRDINWPNITSRPARTPPPTTPPPRPPRRVGHTRSKSCTATVVHSPLPRHNSSSSAAMLGRSTAARNISQSPKPLLSPSSSSTATTTTTTATTSNVSNDTSSLFDRASATRNDIRHVATHPRAFHSLSALPRSEEEATLTTNVKHNSDPTIMDASFFTMTDPASTFKSTVNDTFRRVSTVSSATDVSITTTIMANRSRQETQTTDVTEEQENTLHGDQLNCYIDKAHEKPDAANESEGDDMGSDFELPINIARVRYDSMMPSDGDEESDEERGTGAFRKNRYRSMFSAPTYQRRNSHGQRISHRFSRSNASETVHELGDNEHDSPPTSRRQSWHIRSLSRSNSSDDGLNTVDNDRSVSGYHNRATRQPNGMLGSRFGNLSPIMSMSNNDTESKLATTALLQDQMEDMNEKEQCPTSDNGALHQQANRRSIVSSSATFLRNSGLFTSLNYDVEESTTGNTPHYYSDQLDVVNDYTNMPSNQTSPSTSLHSESILAMTASKKSTRSIEPLPNDIDVDQLVEDGQLSDADEADDDLPDPLLTQRPPRFRADSLEELTPEMHFTSVATRDTATSNAPPSAIELNGLSAVPRARKGGHRNSFGEMESYHHRHAAARRRESIQQQHINVNPSQRTSWQSATSNQANAINSTPSLNRYHRRAFSADVASDVNGWRDPCLRITTKEKSIVSNENNSSSNGNNTIKRSEPPQSPRVARLSAELNSIRRKLMTLYLMTDEGPEEASSVTDASAAADMAANAVHHNATPTTNVANDTKEGAATTDTNTAVGATPGYGWVAKNVRRVMYAARDGYRDDLDTDVNGNEHQHQATSNMTADNDTAMMLSNTKQGSNELAILPSSSSSSSAASTATSNIVSSSTIAVPLGLTVPNAMNRSNSHKSEQVESAAVTDIEDDNELTDDEQIAEDNHRSLMTLLSKQARAESILVRSLEVMRDDFWRPLHDHYCRDSSFSGWLGRRTCSFTGRGRGLSRNNSTATSASSSSSTNCCGGPSSSSVITTTEGGNESSGFTRLDGGPSTTAIIRRKSHESLLNQNSDVISHLGGQRMAEIIEAEATSTDTPTMVRDINSIFAFVPELLAFHLDFSSELQTLQQEGGSIDRVVALFERRVRGLRLYADYVDRYPRAFISLERLCYRDNKFAKQLRECERLAGYVNLRSILTKPRERICAYVGFLEVAADLCPTGSLSQKIADNSVDELHRLLECLTPDLDRITILEQVAAVQRRILNMPQPLLHMESRLLHQGELLYYPKTGQANGRMHCFLFNDRLVVAKETNEAHHQYNHQTTIMLSRTVVTASEASTGRFRHVFCLRAGTWPAIFQADDWDSFRTWTEYLRLALDALPNDPMIPTRFRLVTKLQLSQMENTRSSMVVVPHFI